MQIFIISLNIFGVIRSRDPGGYDLGELDQALFLYLDGHDPSAIQEQRRERLYLSLYLSFCSPFFPFFFLRLSVSKLRDMRV